MSACGRVPYTAGFGIGVVSERSLENWSTEKHARKGPLKRDRRQRELPSHSYFLGHPTMHPTRRRSVGTLRRSTIENTAHGTRLVSRFFQLPRGSTARERLVPCSQQLQCGPTSAIPQADLCTTHAIAHKSSHTHAAAAARSKKPPLD